VKYAATLDGRIATAHGQSQWISSPASLKFAHRLRARHDAVLVGAQTVIKDNPELTVRHIRGRNPLRIVVDFSLRVPLQAKVFQNLSAADTIIATAKPADDPQFQHFADSGVQMISTDADNEGKVDLKKLFKILAARGISSILIEGGAQIITTVLNENLTSRLVAIIAPKIIGTGIEAVGKLDIIDLAHAKKLNFQKIKRIGPDIMIDSRLR
ncbi:MAG: dihydrofolate reductase family protein, partial [Smithellaceae bacterium]